MARKPSPLPDSFDPLEMALDADRGDPAEDSPARVLLVNQNRLVLADLRHRALQIASERAGLALKMLTGLAGATAALVLIALAWQAHDARGLVVEPFPTPPDLAAKGLTGQAVAARFLDRLRDMQARTDSARAPSSYGNDWASGFKVEIPGAGISLDDLERFLHGWLGHETHVSGEVSRTADGLQLSVRAGDKVGQTFTVKGDDMDGLLQQAALGLYQSEQPYRYAIYLQKQGRLDEGEAALRELGYNGPHDEQAFALAGLANILCFTRRDCRAALAVARHALEIDPQAIKPLWNISDAQGQLDQREARLQTQRAVAARGKDPKITDVAFNQVRVGGQAVILEMLGDYAGAARMYDREAHLPDYAGNARQAVLSEIDDLALAHDFPGWRALLALYTPTFQQPHALEALAFTRAMVLEDWAGALADDHVSAALWQDSSPTHMAAVAVAKAHLGDIAGAQALLAPMAGDCFSCLIARGDVAALAGDGAGADRWLAEAVRQGPSLPDAYLDWGKVKMARGDLRGAVALFSQAVLKAPRYAEPLSAWAEALLRQGDAKGAEAKLRQTLALSPNWGRARAQLGEALMKQGKAAEARAEWQAALGMDLTAGERARTQYWMTGGH